MSTDHPDSSARPIHRRLSLGLAGGLAGSILCGLVGMAPSASAEGLLGALKSRVAVAKAATCPTALTSQPFKQWGDESAYSLVSGGSFETSPTEWTLRGGAQPTSGSESFAVTGALGKSSLALPAKASAQSPFVCIASSEDAFRFFLRSEAAESTLTAELVYKTAIGSIAVPVNRLSAKSAWAPSPRIATGSLIATIVAGGTAEMAVRFTATSGASRIDDVYLDPRMSR
jgi:hypothetical protein